MPQKNPPQAAVVLTQADRRVSLWQGTDITTSMASLKKQMRGWLHLFQILPASYGFHFESEPRFISQKTDYAAVSEAAGF